MEQCLDFSIADLNPTPLLVLGIICLIILVWSPIFVSNCLLDRVTTIFVVWSGLGTQLFNM